MKNKRYCAGFLVLILALALLMTGCGGNQQNRGETTEATIATDQTGTEANTPAEEETGSGHGTGHNGSGGNSAGDIGMAQVQSIVLAKVPGASAANISEMEREHDDGHLVYEGAIYYNGYEYEFEVDGTTGNLLKWEIDD